MGKKWLLVFLVVFFVILAGCAGQQQGKQGDKQEEKQQTTTQVDREKQKISTPDLAGGKEKEVRRPHPMTLADLRQKYPGVFVLNGPSNKRQVALTFDDGPDLEYTPQILDVLKKNNVKATFFLVGKRAQAHPDVVKRMVREGHEVGNHSFSHANLPKVSMAAFQKELQQTDKIIRSLAGYNPKMFRPPYGETNEQQILWLSKNNYTIVNWNVDSLDWKGLSSGQVRDNVLSAIFPGSIVLQHSAGGNGEDLSGTVKALPQIIERLRADGVQFVTVSKLLNIPKSR